MKLSTKIIIALGSILAILALIFMIKWQHDLSVSQKSIETQMVEMKKFADGVVRSQTNVVSKDDLNTFAKDIGLNITAIQNDVKLLNASIVGISNTQVQTPGFHGNGLGSTSTKADATAPGLPLGATDPFGYLKNIQIYSANEPFSNGLNVPFGDFGFSSWKDKPWTVNIYPRDYSVDSVISEDQAGKKFIYNKITIKTQDKTYTVPISNSTFKEALPAPSFSFNPRIFMSVQAGALINPVPSPEAVPSVGVSLFSYGKTKIDPDVSLLGISLGVEVRAVRPNIAITPIGYNIGHNIPLLHNLFIAPSVSIDTRGSVGVFGGFQVNL